MLIVRDITNPHAAYTVGTFDTVRAVKRDIMDAQYTIVAFEEDADHPGCFDAIIARVDGLSGRASDLRQFTIEPMGAL